ncbi:MAG: TlpA family protein disulfide reductase [Gramella sp.]|nr:TlpA family protein disulfide reductase [Christiangramia sp.]
MKILKTGWIQYALLGIIAITLYVTGLHAEVIGFAQRGLLETGLMNPDLDKKETNINSFSNSDARKTQPSPNASFDLKLRDENGVMIPFGRFKGKVIFINFWATWCPPCLAEMPAINNLYQKMGDDVVFVMLSMDQEFETAVSFKKRKGYNFPIYSLGSSLPLMYQSRTLPTTYVISADGKLELTHKGMSNYDTADFIEFLNNLN